MAMVTETPAGTCPNCGTHGLIPISSEPLYCGRIAHHRPLAA
jgi:hypothetical protein